MAGTRGSWEPGTPTPLTSPQHPTVPARIVNISAPVTVNEGGNVNLLCLAVGRPEPTVTWRQLRGEDPTPDLKPLLLLRSLGPSAPHIPLARFPEAPFSPLRIP